MGAPHAYSHKTGDGTVKSGPGILHEAHLAAGSDAATAIVYDNTAASGTVICKLTAGANGSDRYAPPGGVSFGAGIHVALTGTGPTASFAYD